MNSAFVDWKIVIIQVLLHKIGYFKINMSLDRITISEVLLKSQISVWL